MFKRLFALCLTFGMAAAAPPALAAACSSRDSLIEQLQQKYSERLAAAGLQGAADARSVMEIWASDETGTFTVILSHANGISCIVAAGTDFFRAAPKSDPEGVAG